MARYGDGGDLARDLGVTRQAVHQARLDGRITRSENGKYDLDAAAIQFRLHTDPEQQRRANAGKIAPPVAAPLSDPDSIDWRGRQARADALRAELELRKAAGELVPREEVLRQLGRRISSVSVQFDALPDRAAAALGVDDAHRRKVRQFLKDELAQILSAVADLGLKEAA